MGQNVAVVGVASNTLYGVPVEQLGGGAPWVKVRKSTNHAFVDGMRGVAIIDGASRTRYIIPVPYEDTGASLCRMSQSIRTLAGCMRFRMPACHTSPSSSIRRLAPSGRKHGSICPS